MDEGYWRHIRERAIHLLRSGRSVREVAQILQHSESWVYKCRQRYQEAGWEGLKSRSRRPHTLARRLPAHVRQAVREARSELEAEAAQGGLKFIGSAAIRTRLKEKGITPLPSKRSIERILRDAQMTQPRPRAKAEEDTYPHLQLTEPHLLVQVDICPRYLKGGQSVACFNAIDVVSRYPVCKAYEHRRSVEAAEFLYLVFREMGVPRYVQMDNEGCFCGGHTHPGVIGKVVRVALMAGAEVVFSPIRHPQSQGHVERFHYTYSRHVWQDTLLETVAQVNQQTEAFLQKYRERPHPRLQERTPAQLHQAFPSRPLPAHFTWPADLGKARLPLYAGKIHFMRKVDAENHIPLLNMKWHIPHAAIGQKVWATLTLAPKESYLEVFDRAPDAPRRTRLAKHAFPLKEEVLPFPPPQKETQEEEKASAPTAQAAPP